MAGIPPPSTSDSDDVVWALQTAAAQWERGERRDAAVWLQRAARAAGAASDDERAIQLGRVAAELLDALPKAPESELSSTTQPDDDAMALSSAIAVAVTVDDGEHGAADDQADDEVVTSAPPIALLDRDVGAGRDKSLRDFRSARSFIGVRDAKPFIDAIEREVESAPPRARRRPPPPPPMPARTPPPDDDSDGIEVVIAAEEPAPRVRVPPPSGVRSEQVSVEELEPLSLEPLSLEPLSLEPLSLEPLSLEPLSLEPLSLEPLSLDPLSDEQPSLDTSAALPPPRQQAKTRPDGPISHPEVNESVSGVPETVALTKELHASEGAEKNAEPSTGETAESRAPKGALAVEPAGQDARLAVEPLSPEPISDRMTSNPTVDLPIDRDAAAAAPESSENRKDISRFEERAVTPASSVQGGLPAAVSPLVDLSVCEAFSDMPEEELLQLQAHVEIQQLARDEEASGFGLAVVVEGEFNVTAMVSDVAAAKLGPRSVLRSRGTILGAVEVRLLCATPHATVATWAEPIVEEAFRALPWVEEELCSRADRIHALVGSTLGPLGYELDAGLLAELTSHMQVRVLIPGETIVERGEEIPGFVVVGVGELQTQVDDGPSTRFVAGELVFASAMLEGGVAPATVLAGANGAVLLWVERAVTQELFMTFPPLLDLLLRL